MLWFVYSFIISFLAPTFFDSQIFCVVKWPLIPNLTVQILEKSHFAKETGAAIHVPPNCTALLNWMDVDPKEFGGTLLEEVSSRVQEQS